MSEDKPATGDPKRSAKDGGDRPSWVDDDPFATKGADPTPPPKVSVDPSLQATEELTPKPPIAPAAQTGRSDAKAATADRTQGTAPAPSPEPQAVGRKRRITEETRRSKPKRHFLGLPLWGWPLLVVLGLAVLLIVFDARNRGRYRLFCQQDHLDVQRGRRLMWPFGYEPMGGLYRRITVPADADCQTQVFRSRAEVESAFLDFIIVQARRSLTSPGSTKLKKVRQQVLQAMRITRLDPHRARRAEVERLLADVAYRQGRAGLARVETELRTAIGRLQEAQKRAGDRYEDLDEWIEHLESLLKTVAPAPGTPPRVPSTPPIPTTPRTPATANTPGSAPAPSPPAPANPPEVPPDAGGPPKSGGILM